MKKIRTIIVDDEMLCREGIRSVVQKDNDFQVVGECRNGREAIEVMKADKPDFVILDVQMPEISGFDVLSALDEDQLPLVLFVTAYDQYALKAFEINAVDYVLKPFSEQRLANSLQRVKGIFRRNDEAEMISSLAQLLAGRKKADESTRLGMKPGTIGDYAERIWVRTARGLKMIPAGSISHIRADEYYAQIICEEGSFLHRESLKKLESILNPELFFRVHRSFIVNLEKVREIRIDEMGDYMIVMKTGLEIPVSRRRRAALLNVARVK